MTQSDPTRDTDDSPYPLQVGDLVFDRLQLSDEYDDPKELATVTGIVDEDVYEATFTDRSTGDEIPLVEYEPNVRHADFDVSTAVVTVTFTGWLNANVPGWDAYADDPDGLLAFLRQREESWSIPVRANSFDYPESRLQLARRAQASRAPPS